MEENSTPNIVERKQGEIGLESSINEHTKRLQKGKKIYHRCREQKRLKKVCLHRNMYSKMKVIYNVDR